MKKTLSFLTLTVLFTSYLYAVETPEAAKPPMDAAMAEKMQKMQKFMAPSDAHKLLEQLEGSWNYTSKFWMAADQAPEQSTGGSENNLIFGGRFLMQQVEGTWMGQPFEGIGYLGYDNIKQTYVSNWMDSMGTAIMSVSGPYQDSDKTLMLSGANSCPLTGGEREVRSEWKIIDADHNSYTSYLKDESGKEFKAMEIIYTRAK